MEPATHNDHNVYILGAGFSRDAGIPLVAGFLNAMRDSLDWLENEERHEEVEAVKQVLAFRRQASAATSWIDVDPDNIEELFSVASGLDPLP